jgi:membrane protease YdiL (CAAX protease family)
MTLRRQTGNALAALWQQVSDTQAAAGAGLVAVAVTVSMVLCDEVIFRAMIQRALHEQLQRPLLAAVAGSLLAVLVSPPGTPVGQALAIHGLMAVVWMLSRRTWPCVLARLTVIALLAAFPGTPV